MDDAKWYVVNTYSGYENTVKATIEKHVDNRNLHHLIHHISIPMEKTKEITEKGEKEVESKVFPGYMLVKMVMTDESWHVVRGIRGVTGFLGDGNTPLPLRDSEIAALGVENPDNETVVVEGELVLNYAVGDGVTIIKGVMENQPATVTEIDLENRKVHVSVSMLGQERVVELDLDQVTSVYE